MHVGVLEREVGAVASSDAARSALSILGNELRRLDRIISRVLDLELCGRALIEPRLVDLGDVVREAVARSVASGARCDVIVEHRGRLLGWWDDIAAAEIVENLLSNASKFGNGRPIRIRVEQTKSGARIVVCDRGRGIAPRDRERIFERGVRSARSRGGGLGLGLWLVREITMAHGGHVTARNGRRGGATFTVTLTQLKRPA
jgi:signal transduction histidine kinase